MAKKKTQTKPKVVELKQPIVINEYVFVIKTSPLERVKAFLKGTVQPLLKPFKIKHKRGSTHKHK